MWGNMLTKSALSISGAVRTTFLNMHCLRSEPNNRPSSATAIQLTNAARTTSARAPFLAEAKASLGIEIGNPLWQATGILEYAKE